MRNVGLYGEREGEGSHALIHYDNVRVPAEALLGGEGQAFAIAQTRLGGGRIHHAMRTIGLAAAGARHDVRARAEPRDAGQRCSPDKQFVQGYIADSYAQLHAVPADGAATPRGRSTSTTTTSKVRKDIAAVKVAMPTVLHDIAWRAMHVHGALGVTNEMPFLGMVTGAAVMGLADGPDRGAQDHGRQAGAARLPAHRGHVAHRVGARASAKPREAKYAELPASTRWATCERTTIDTTRLAEWMDGAELPGEGEPLRGAVPVRRHAERDLRAAAAARALRAPHATARRSRRPRQGHPAGVAHHRGARRHRRAAHQGHRRVRPTPSVLGRTVLPDGLRRRLVADGSARHVARAVRQRPRAPGPGWATNWPRASRCCRRSTGGPRACSDLGRPDGFHERQVDRWIGFLERIKNRELPTASEVATELAAGPRAARLRPRADARRLPVRQRDVPARRARADWPRSSTGRWAPSAIRSWTSAGWCRAGRTDTARTGTSAMSYVDMRGDAVARPRWSRTTPRCPAARSTTWTTTWCWPSGSWRSCWSRASSARATTRSCWPSGRSSLDLMRRAADLAESTDYR